MQSILLLIGPDGWGPLLLQGAVVTVLLAVTTVPFGFGGGLLLAVLKGSPSRLVRIGCDTYTTFFRGIPDLLALFIIYFGLQALIDIAGKRVMPDMHLELNAFVAGVIALSVVVSAYSSEVWVAALSAIPRGQTEAALSLGLTKQQTFRRVILPQLARVALPGLGNIWTILLKDTSLISTLAVMDLLRAASEASRFTRSPLLFYCVAAGIYLVISIVCGRVQAQLERRSNRAYA
jgi:polar amino acid transport system permease protein